MAPLEKWVLGVKKTCRSQFLAFESVHLEGCETNHKTRQASKPGNGGVSACGRNTKDSGLHVNEGIRGAGGGDSF